MPNLRHSFVSAKADGSDASLVKPSDWNSVLQYGTTSSVTGTDAVVRESLPLDRTYYVRADGSDSNTGLTNTSTGAFLTLSGAYAAAKSLDLNNKTAYISVQAGTFAGLTISDPFLGGNLTFIGDNTTPSNVVIDCAASNNVGFQFSCPLPGTVTISGFKFVDNTAPSVSSAIYIVSPGVNVVLSGGSAFGATNKLGTALGCVAGGSKLAIQSTAMTITAGATIFMFPADNGLITVDVPHTVTLTSTPDFSFFVDANRGGVLHVNASSTYSGTATGTRFIALENGVIDTNGGGVNYFPGSIAGSTQTGGVYA